MTNTHSPVTNFRIQSTDKLEAIYLTSPAFQGITPSIILPGTEGTQDRCCHKTTGFDAPGEQVYAIQYQKVRFKWLSRKKTDTAHLEPGYRWKPCSVEDSWRGVEGDEEDDEEELLETSLEDDT